MISKWGATAHNPHRGLLNIYKTHFTTPPLDTQSIFATKIPQFNSPHQGINIPSG